MKWVRNVRASLRNAIAACRACGVAGTITAPRSVAVVLGAAAGARGVLVASQPRRRSASGRTERDESAYGLGQIGIDWGTFERR